MKVQEKQPKSRKNLALAREPKYKFKRYQKRIGRYPESALADRIYRNQDNLAYCKRHGIRLSGSILGWPKKDAAADKKAEYIDNADRVEVERSFSFAKRCYGLGKILCCFMSKNATWIYWWLNEKTLI